ncbi:hypothetical protein OCU04_006485 [Sclerotinia nivalis]|uniref:Uncharacterized protein n=1 Tax=Sclerotinia nivalis TaxID=352851 RepID=A0A9X0DLC2_9HELO|nr:hypothetical protein OCU04_006485 [Sclerotinia nivalis]
MSYYYPYPYPIYPSSHYIPIPIIPLHAPTTVTTISTPLIQQTPGWNPVHGHDSGPAPPGLGNRVVGLATGLAVSIGGPIVGAASLHVGAHTVGLCTNCGNGGVNANASTGTIAPATSSAPDLASGAQPGSQPGTQPQPSSSSPKPKSKSILKATPSTTSNPSSSSSSPTKSNLDPPLNILTHANTNANANANGNSGSSS